MLNEHAKESTRKYKTQLYKTKCTGILNTHKF